MGSRSKGRKRGSRNRGYFYRKGRGWCASDGAPLRFESGRPIKDQRTAQDVLQEACYRHAMAKRRPVEEAAALDQATVKEMCGYYLDYAKDTGAPSTFSHRADCLYDFCFGMPAAARDKSGDGPTKPKASRKASRKAKPKPPPKRIHDGYGEMLVRDLKPLHIDRWLAAHEGWKGCRRTRVQAVKRALNYGVKAGFLSRNPIKGYAVARSNMRKTYITPEQEGACYEYAKPALATAIQVCIRTGARYGCEFAKLTAKHVRSTDNGMEWIFSPKESKTKKERIIRIPNTEKTAREVIAIVERQMKLHPEGPLFRNNVGKPWTQSNLGGAFGRLKKRLARKGIKLDDDACMYACRHTYAKRAIAGFWTGKPTTIEVLAALMGNSREVCWAHYAGWCDAYMQPLWASA